ncbi:WXG100 family type VII secretion target [Streptacidiphilus sp. MAP5-3]|uniref:WXG100 family type VII secretion target n=1 Tax=unclassified Streptacidiphilus TaxID=2643834 RepID=UPI0035113ABE
MRIEDPGGGWSATTNFETMSHQQLYDMVANSNPSSVQSIGDTLSTASTQVQSVADDLNTHLSKLEWSGAAAESFQTWARQIVQAADDLSVFHNNAGLAVQTAGSTLSSVKAAMPPVPQKEMELIAAYKRQQLITANPGQLPTVVGGRVQPPAAVSTTPQFGGGITQAQAYAAQTAVDQAHQEAITQMERLGGAYVGATQTMDLNAEPVFPPPPANVMPPQGGGITGGSTYVQGPNGGGTTTTRRVTGTGSVTGTSSVTGSTNNGNNGGGMVARQPTAPGRGPGSTLQGVNPPTTGTGTGTVHTPGGGPTGGAGGGGTSGGGGGVIAPPPGSGGTGRLGGGSGTGRSGSPGGLGDGSGRVGAGGEGGGSGGESGISGGLKGDSGISGGMAESGLGSGGVGGGIGGRGLGGSVSGSVGASSESAVAGDGVSGSTTAQAGYASEGSGSAAGGAAGESSTSGGMMGGGGMGGLANAAGRGRKRGSRAGYLAEDEETWNAAKGQSNPAVIE